MALRIKKDKSIVCAAISKEQKEDIYIDDTIHQALCNRKLIVAEPEPQHSNNGGLWWLKGCEPKNINIENYWYE